MDISIKEYITSLKSDRNACSISPINILKAISSGRSGAGIYLVEYGDKRTLGILKNSSYNEFEHCNTALDIARKNGVSVNIASILHSSRIDVEGSSQYFILYELAGDSMKPRMLNDMVQHEEFISESTVLSILRFMMEWKKSEEKILELTPIEAVKMELGYKYLDDKYNAAYRNIGVEKKWYMLQNKPYLLPNPCAFIEDSENWEEKLFPYRTSISHNDLHGGNIILNGELPMLIDFAEYKTDSNIFYDLLYLEFHLIFDYYMLDKPDSLVPWIEYCERLSSEPYDITIPSCKGAGIFRSILPVLRKSLSRYQDSRNTYYHMQIYLAGISVGLNVMRRSKDRNKQIAGFIYASYYMKSLLHMSDISLYIPDPDDCCKFDVSSSITSIESMSTQHINRDLKFIYKFAKMGKKVSDTQIDELLRPKRNRIILDTGNAIQPGVIDNHCTTGGYQYKSGRLESVTGIISMMPDLVTDNIDDYVQEIEIIVHTNPDFDCFSSVYVVQHLLLYGRLPKKIAVLVDYAEAADGGYMRIDSNLLFSPYNVASVIWKALSLNKSIPGEKFQEECLMRGVNLIKYCMDRLDEIKFGEISLYNYTLLSHALEFDAEFEVLKQDFGQYLLDKQNNNARQVLVSLPLKKKKGFQEVYGMFWEGIPACTLHKGWARSDYNSPDINGYTFTFIPLYEKCIYHKELGDVRVSRVIVSVKPDAEVHLKGLAEELEKRELDKEEALFGEKKNLWRSRGEKRYPDSWCTSENPWYDGRDRMFTIIDSPNEGSLLSIQEIKETVANYIFTFGTYSSFHGLINII